MEYIWDTTLLAVSPDDLRSMLRVPFRELPDDHLLLFDATVSDFYFEFEPQEDVARFLQHSHFACITDGRLIASREDLFGLADVQAEVPPMESLTIDLAAKLPRPLRDIPVPESFAAICRGDEFQGQLTVCKCGISGCFSQYAWVRESICIALFTISAASLTEVAWFPFRFQVA